MSKAKSAAALKRVIWSVNPFEEKNEMRHQVVSALKYIGHRVPSVKIEPTYVLSPAELEVAMEFSQPWIKQYKPSAEKAMEHLSGQYGISQLKEPQVLIQRSPSLSSSVNALARHAKDTRADLIVTGTHAREGLSRLMLGSYTETLLLHSKTPLLVVGPHAEVLHRDHILFATDLSAHSILAFKRILSLARDLRARLTILHIVPHPVEPVIQSGIYLMGGGWVPVAEFMSQDESKKRRHGDKWIAEAKKIGVQAEFVIERGMPGKGGSIVQGILSAAQSRHAGMIALAAHSGVFAASLLGSIARQVIRHAPCPVWTWKSVGK